jgi:hypothetical protein
MHVDYVESECPDGWVAASKGIARGTTTDFCCPKYVRTYQYQHISIDLSNDVVNGIFSRLEQQRSPV